MPTIKKRPHKIHGKELLVFSLGGNIQEEICNRVYEMMEKYSKLRAMRS